MRRLWEGEAPYRHTRHTIPSPGWSGGPYGVGQRMQIAHTRAMVHAALHGALKDVPTTIDANFGIAVPVSCPDVPPEILNPRHTWSNAAAYDAQAQKLAGLFAENFHAFAAQVTPEVRAAGPHVR